ncbi:MAG TPA: efflux RND transporter periplasmic adaptor subunit [Labilithrix sp.]|nr:efflux RND transporter periplasmic adaptor subunit [Labilithrix sp.]
MSRRSRAAATFLALSLLVVAPACGRDAPARPAAADAGSVHGGAPVARVDPSLLAAGRVTVAPASRRAMRGDVRLPAEVVPSESGAAELGALVSGRLATIEVHEGDAVKRGQVVAYVDSPEAARAAADLIRARARAFAATRKLERQLGLEQDRATSASAVDEARVELATASADAAASRALLASLGMAEPPEAAGPLAMRVPVRSPIDGVLVERTVSLGAPVSPDKTLFRVLARDHVLVEARWTDATTAPPIKGTVVKLLPRGGDGRVSCEGAVVSTLAVVDERTLARRVRIVPVAPCPMLVAGSYIDASFTSAAVAGVTPQTLAIPKEAVVDVRGAALVFVATPERGVFVGRAVRVGAATSDDITIEDGLTEGENVVVSGAILLKGELLRTELESP